MSKYHCHSTSQNIKIRSLAKQHFFVPMPKQGCFVNRSLSSAWGARRRGTILTASTRNKPLTFFQYRGYECLQMYLHVSIRHPYVTLKQTVNFFPPVQQPQWVQASSLVRFRDHTQTHHIRQDSSGRVISPSQRQLPAQHAKFRRDVHPCYWQNSNPQSRPQIYTADCAETGSGRVKLASIVLKLES